MWKIDMAVCQGLTTKTCTDQAAAWNSGTKRNVQPAVLEDIDFRLQKRTVDPPSAKRSRPTFVPPTAEEVKKLHEESPFPDLFKIPGTLLYETLSAPLREQPPAADTMVIRTHGDHEGDDAPNCCLLCSSFYDKPTFAVDQNWVGCTIVPVILATA
ncbi:hypothetical protein MTO96_051970 [Rhipicephalus appendiculatus]